MLLTASMDGGMKLFDLLQPRPLYSFFPPVSAVSVSSGLADADWSRARPLVFACCGEGKHQVLVYDLVANKHEPVLAIPFQRSGAVGGGGASDLGGGRGGGRDGSGKSVTRVRFNPVQRGLLMAGGSDGEVKVFRLPWQFSCSAKQSELNTVNRMMSGK